MHTQSTLHKFQVFKNLRYLYRIEEFRRSRSKENVLPASEIIKRNEWLTRKMRKFFPESTVQEVLRYRRSLGTDDAVVGDFMNNEQPIHHVPRDWHYQRAIRVVTEQMRPNRILHPVAFPDLRGYPAELRTSAELPWTDPSFKFTPKGRDVDQETDRPRVAQPTVNKLQKFAKSTTVAPYLRWKQELELIKDSDISYHNLYNEIFSYNRPLIHRIKDKQEPFWKDGKPVPHERLKLHLRTHVVPDTKPDKVRAVFGTPKLLLHAELMFIWPMQATYMNTKAGRMLWGNEISRGGWVKLMQEFMHDGNIGTCLSMDWSQFDRRLLHEVMRDVHKIWRSYFDFSSYEATTRYPEQEHMTSERLENLWTWMTESIFNTPIELPNGQVWGWRHNGFGSGYQQTQLMDTFCNMLMTYTCLSKLGVDIESDRFKSRFQGDDGIMVMPELMFKLYGKNFLKMLSNEALYYFNAKLSADKSFISDRVSGSYVLGYYNTNGHPFRTEEDLLSHLMYPEQDQHYAALAASAVGLARASLGSSKQFYDLCKDIFEDITIKHETKPRWGTLKWMIRANMFESLAAIESSDFPEYNRILEDGINPLQRTKAMNQRVWRTESQGERGEIVFLNEL